MRALTSAIERRLGRSEAGLTVIEIVIAGMILVVGGLGVLGMVDAATHNTFRAEQSQVVNNVLQREMEAIKALPYEEIALSELPGEEEGANNPNSRVADGTFDLNRADAASDPKPMVSGGSVAPGPERFQAENINIGVSVYRYVVWDQCPEAWLCPSGEEKMKRIVVVAKLDPTAPGGGNRRYQELQGQVADPDAEPTENAGPGAGGDDTVWWKLWLTDTTCDEPERKEHPETDGSHPTHNTRGDCADGLVEGENVPGAPDLLWSADLDDEEDRKYDYATDVEPQPDADEGLQLMPSGKCDSPGMFGLALGVAVGPDSDANAFRKIHRWLTPPIPSGEEVTLTGEGTFLLRTRTVSQFVYSGRICAWLFVRTYGEGPPADTPVINSGPPLSLHFEHFEQSWPHSGWAQVSLPLAFEDQDGFPVTLPPGSRLGLALSVAEDTETGLQFLYDQPSFDSQLQLGTTGALPEWAAD